MFSFFKIDNSQRSIPSLDGLRAISIILVIISHISVGIYSDYAHNFTRTESIIQSLFLVGHLGVTIFFVISGFLITTILLKEERVNLRKFYFRRLLRIVPPFYFYLLVILIIALVQQQYSFYNLIAALTFTKNYFSDPSAVGAWTLGHSWSLSVEEQFYILFPIVLLLAGRKKGLVFICLVILVCPLFRLIAVLNNPELSMEFSRFEMVADSLAVGCLLAGARSWLHQRKWYTTLLNAKISSYFPLAILLITWLGRFPAYLPKTLYAVLAISVQNLLIVIFLDKVITNYQGRIGKFLNTRLIVFIGTISYSIYLWQQLFLDASLKLPIAIKLLLVIITSLASYFFVEKTSLKLRNYLEAKYKIGK